MNDQNFFENDIFGNISPIFLFCSVISTKLKNGLPMISGSRYNLLSENILGLSIPSWISGGILSGLNRPKLEAITSKSDSVLGSSTSDSASEKWMQYRQINKKAQFHIYKAVLVQKRRKIKKHANIQVHINNACVFKWM